MVKLTPVSCCIRPVLPRPAWRDWCWLPSPRCGRCPAIRPSPPPPGHPSRASRPLSPARPLLPGSAARARGASAHVALARRVERSTGQPFFVGGVFPGRPGIYVPIKETVTSFRDVLEGKADSLPEQAFFLAGTLDDVRANAAKLQA